jgi:predicted nucleotidyltransferase
MNKNSQKCITEMEREFAGIRRQIIEKIDPDRIMLFGSLARKDVSRSSDIDILIIKKTRKSFKKRMCELYDKIDYRWPTEMLCYTPAEIQRLKGKNMFLKNVLREGLVVYEK